MSRDDRFSAQRRPLLQALGAGTTLSMLGGTAVAQRDDGMGGDEDERDEDGGDDDGETPTTGTVHTVETRISGPPTNPNRPVDFFYQPTGLHVEPGDVVKWVFTTPDHNVVSYHPAFGMRRRVPIGVSAISSPLLGWRPDSIAADQIEPPAELEGGEDTGGEEDDEGETSDGDDGETGADDGAPREPVPDMWLHAFETPGVYDLLCSPHEAYGMAMRVVVGDVTDTMFETEDSETLPEPRVGPVGLARVTLTDPALDPENIVSEGTVAWEDLEATETDGTGDDGDGGSEDGGDEEET